MAERVLTRRDLNRALLARQLLLERSPVAVARAVEQVAGLQAQWDPSPPVGLWTRIGEFPEQAFASLVKATLMRGTIHLVTRRDYRLLYPALRPAIARYPRRYLRDKAADLDGLAARALEFASEPRTTAEMVELSAARASGFSFAATRRSSASASATSRPPTSRSRHLKRDSATSSAATWERSARPRSSTQPRGVGSRSASCAPPLTRSTSSNSTAASTTSPTPRAPTATRRRRRGSFRDSTTSSSPMPTARG